MPGNARNKLNASAIHGVLLIAGVIAFFGQSWSVFLLLVIALLATSVMSGDIRPTGSRKKR